MPIKVTTELQRLLLRAATNDFLGGSPFGNRDGQPFVKFDTLQVQCVNGEVRVTLRYRDDDVITFVGDSIEGLTTHFEGVSGALDFTLT